jgi:hypothetical protein
LNLLQHRFPDLFYVHRSNHQSQPPDDTQRQFNKANTIQLSVDQFRSAVFCCPVCRLDEWIIIPIVDLLPHGVAAHSLASSNI